MRRAQPPLPLQICPPRAPRLSRLRMAAKHSGSPVLGPLVLGPRWPRYSQPSATLKKAKALMSRVRKVWGWIAVLRAGPQTPCLCNKPQFKSRVHGASVSLRPHQSFHSDGVVRVTWRGGIEVPLKPAASHFYAT